MLTIGELVDGCELEFVAGRSGASTPVRWVHVSEQDDPTPWLSGGELLLTTGMTLLDEDQQRRYVRRLVEHHLCGLGFGSGFTHAHVPGAIVDEAATLDFPLFEVPYEMPFIAITERAFTSLVSEQFDVLQRAVTIQRRMERLVLDERGLDEVVRGLAGAIAASVMVVDGSGVVLASHAFRRPLAESVSEAIAAEVARRSRTGTPVRPFVTEVPTVAGRGIGIPVPSGGRHGSPTWLVALPESESVAEFERFTAHHAVMVVALALMRERVVAATERRLAGDVLGAALGGRIEPEELASRLVPFGIGPTAAVLLFAANDPELLESRLDGILSALGVPALVAVVATNRRRLLAAVVAADEHGVAGATTLELAERVRGLLADGGAEVRASLSRVSPVASLRRSFHEARCALEIGGFSVDGAAAPMVASSSDLGAYRLLLALQEDEGLRQYCDEVLGPIENARGGNGEDLLRSLEVYLEHNGSWEAAARALFCHRHTLRYRMTRVEELTGRRLDRIDNRIELWLALRGRELIGATNGMLR